MTTNLAITVILVFEPAYTCLVHFCTRAHDNTPVSRYLHIAPQPCHVSECVCHTHVMTNEVEKSSVPSRPRRQSAFFRWRWCISPPQLSQQRHMQKKSPTTGKRMAKSRPTAAHTRKPIS